jgi:hypothetical protein
MKIYVTTVDPIKLEVQHDGVTVFADMNGPYDMKGVCFPQIRTATSINDLPPKLAASILKAMFWRVPVPVA